MSIDRTELRRLADRYQGFPLANEMASAVGELDAQARRIAELEAGLREAIQWIADRSSDHSIFINRLSKLVNSEET